MQGWLDEGMCLLPPLSPGPTEPQPCSLRGRDRDTQVPPGLRSMCDTPR